MSVDNYLGKLWISRLGGWNNRCLIPAEKSALCDTLSLQQSYHQGIQSSDRETIRYMQDKIGLSSFPLS